MTVRVGQTWKSNDPRHKAPVHFAILEVREHEDPHFAIAKVENVGGGNPRRIRLDRFKPKSNGYVMVTETVTP